MSDSSPKRIASKWNARYAYANAKKPKPTPADVLINGAHFIPASGVAVDIACGLGGNAVYLAEKGLSVFAWDLSATAIESIQQRPNAAGQNLVAQVRDVLAHPPEQNRFDVIVVSRFLDRALCAELSAALRPNGVLFYQTFTAGLSNPDYLLSENELPSLFPELTLCHAYESPLNSRGFSEAQYIGRKSKE